MPPRTVVDEQILIAVVVRVGKRGGDADPIWQSDARFRRDVLEPSSAEILPQLVAADLIHEVDVVQPVAVDVRHGDTVAVIVVDRFVVLAGVLDDVVLEGDAAVFDPVGELELVEDLELVGRCQLRALPRLKRIGANIGVGHEHFLRRRSRGWTRRPAPADEQGDERDWHEQRP